jgi:hypothetical protein
MRFEYTAAFRLMRQEQDMMKRLLLNLATASVLVASAGVSMAQTTPMPTTPTTKILAIGTFPPGTDMQLEIAVIVGRVAGYGATHAKTPFG